MNDKFFNLPQKKQQAILNAGYRVFSMNSYKKSPMQDIADAAGISKSLLFHYFQNKQELYLFLWDNCARITMEYLTKYGCYEETDLFEMLYRGMRAKIHIMNRYPDMGSFVIKAFYEKDPAIAPRIHQSYEKYKNLKANPALKQVDKSMFVPGIDLSMMYREMYLASEGYLWEMMQQTGKVDVEKMEQDFTKMIEFWKQIYLKKGESDESH